MFMLNGRVFITRVWVVVMVFLSSDYPGCHRCDVGFMDKAGGFTYSTDNFSTSFFAVYLVIMAICRKGVGLFCRMFNFGL